MMQKIFRSTALAGVLVLPFSGGASALPDQLAEYFAPPGTFYLQGSSDVEIVDFSREKIIRICASRKTPNEVGPDSRPVGLKVKYEGRERVIRPGNCLMFEAKQVSVSPADTLPDGWILEGSYDAR
jgi:hypothetical protein